MAELLRLGAREGRDARGRQQLSRHARDGRRGHQVPSGQLEVAVVLHHPHEARLGPADAVERRKVGVLKGLGDLDHAVGPKVGQHDGVAVLDGAHGNAGVVDDHEGVEPLVGDRGVSRAAQGLDGRLGVLERVRRLAQDVRLPPALDDLPVGLVPVHGHAHAPAARRDLGVDSCGQRLEHLLELLDEADRAAVGDVAAVGQDVHPDPLGAALRRAPDEQEELVGARVDAAVGEQADKVERVVGERLGDVLEAVVGKDRLVLEGDVDEPGALVDDLARA